MAMLDLTKQFSGLTTYSHTNQGMILDWCPTFMPEVDKTMLGGIPLSGKVTEIFGQPQVGKTTLVLSAMKTLIQSGCQIVVFDVEGTTSKVRMRELGVDPNKVLLPQHSIDKKGHIKPFTIEEIQNWIEKIAPICIKAKQPVVFIWDTIAATLSKVEAKAGAGNATMGQQARALTVLFRKIEPYLSGQYVTLVCLNQARARIGDTNPYTSKIPTTVGGKGLDHAVSLKLMMRKGKTIKASSTSKQGIGHQARLTFVKSKIGGNSGETGIIDIFSRGGRGCDFVYNLYDEARDKGLITGTAWQNYHSLNGKNIKEQGSTNFINFLRTDKGKPYLYEIWQRLIKFLFHNCYPPLFNEHVVLSSKTYPFLKGMRAYYIKKQEKLPKRLQNSNYLTWKPSHLNTIKKVVK